MIEVVILAGISILLIVVHQFIQYKQTNRIFIIPAVISIVIIITGVVLAYYSNVVDTEIRNGQVISKQREEVFCSHSYQCNCRQTCTGSGSNQSCHTVCDTCYEHLNDYDWVVNTSIPHKFNIDRIDRQGKREPPRFTQVKIGDSVSDTFTHVNYIKGAEHSLFHKDVSNNLIEKVPPYPKTVYDYQYVDRVIGIGVPIDKTWNKKLQNMLGKHGPTKQVNVIIVLHNLGDDFVNAIESKWLGGKKNDVIVVVGVSDSMIYNVGVVSWTDNNIFKVELRDAIQNTEKFDFDNILNIIEVQILKNFQRKHMADFEYLKNDIDISMGMLSLIFVISMIGYVVAYCVQKDARCRGQWRMRRY